MSNSSCAVAEGSAWASLPLGSDVLRRKDTNNKVPGLVILEIVPSLQMRHFPFQFILDELSQGPLGLVVESKGGRRRTQHI